MISQFSVKNFRCFRAASVRLGPLTVLVGPNASGKTAMLHAIAGHELESANNVWRHDKGLRVEFQWHDPQEPINYDFVFDAGGALQSRNGRALRTGQYLHLDPPQMRAFLSLQEQTRLGVHGENLANVIATLPRRVQEQLARELARVVPVVQDVTLRPYSSGSHRLVFQDRWNPALWYEPSEVSDGTMLALGLLTLKHQESPVSIVAIEEPERGLHPYLLGDMVTMLRTLTRVESGKPSLQIVLATQSAELLEFLEPDEVRFLTRHADDGSVSVVESTDAENWREAYEAHQESLASLWLSGGLGGVPTS